MKEDKNVYIVINTHPKMSFNREKFHYMEKPIKTAFENWDSAWKYIIDNNKDGLWHVVIEPVQNRIANKRDPRSWLRGICKNCGYNAVVVKPNLKNYPDNWYQWNCSNSLCKHHQCEDTKSEEIPSWVEAERI